jgi:Flp pilus assembly protein TadG
MLLRNAGLSSTARSACRRGTIIPLLAVSLTALVGFLALGIDLGMLVIAKAQAQNAADLAALTASRTLTGDSTSNYNQGPATTNAQNILTWNAILGQSIQSPQLQLTYGTYDYNQTTQQFNANFPGTAGTPTSAVTATVSSNNPPSAFSTIFGFQFLPNVTASATAVHRPRDFALVMDLSGSMRMGTCLGFDFWTQTRTTNNPDPLYPRFGAYSSSGAAVQGPSANRTSGVDNYTIPPSNTTAANASYSLTYVNGFYQNAAYATPLIRAFDSYTSSDGGITWSPPSGTASPQLPPATYATTPGGDVPLYQKGSTSVYAKHVMDVVGGSSRNSSWELDGYSNYTNGVLSNAAVGQSNYQKAPFYGYTQGPGYYGKSFAIWPPDPRRPLTTANDSATIQQFLKDFGYNNADFFNGTTGPPLKGIYNATSTPGSQTWPWPNDGGTTLSNYLTSKVYVPGGSRLLQTTDPQYQQIMRLYNWNYVIDNLGTTPADWRLRFFGTNDNTKLFNGSGSLNAPGSSTYTINYNEILRWIASTPNPFPQQMRAGRIRYYSAIPTAITGSWPNYGSTDQRFWKEFIDYVLGFYQTGANTYQDVSGMAGLGGDFTWGTVSRHSPPSMTQYMNYTDVPSRPLMRLWFGPTNMVDYMHNYNMEGWVGSPYFWMTPGDSYEAPSYSGKQGFLGAIQTMEANHPNDWFSTICYSWPRSSANGGFGRFNTVRSPLGPNYAYAQAAMLFPFSTINADGSTNNTEITPYDPDPSTGSIPSSDFTDTPRGDGDTCFAMALMLAYNQFATTQPSDGTLRSYATSVPITFPTGMAGGMGRKGAQKVVIFETDGLANCDATANLVNAGSYKYYQIRYNMNAPNGSEYPAINVTNINDPTVLNHVYSLVQQLATDYGTARNPFRLYGIGFGPVFQGPDANSALSTLQTMQYYAGTQSSPNTPLPASQIVAGTDSQMSANMTTAFTNILENGIQIALIQ